MRKTAKTSVRLFIFSSIFFIVLGMVFRLWRINQNEFVFYDEGFYLNYNRALGEMVKTHFPLDTVDLKKAFVHYARTCMASGKSLWFLLVDSRIFFNRLYEWFWARILASVFGILTIFLTYAFAKQFFRSAGIALTAAVLIAVLPSHVFYSRVGLQETLSTFLVMLGFYFYVFPQRFSWRTFLAGLFFGLAFFSNYRLIMLPALIVATEMWLSWTERRWFDLRKFTWCVLTFLAMVFGAGGILFGGVNTYIIFAWVFHQQHLAAPQFHWINFLSYPYYLFRLDQPLLLCLFLANAYLFFRGQRRLLLPFILVLIQMLIFSLPEEKGARYLCVVFPFITMAVSYAVVYFYNSMKTPLKRILWTSLCVLLVILLSWRSYRIAEIDSDYDKSAEFLLAKDEGVKFLSTQPFVHNLYTPGFTRVYGAPHTFDQLMAEFSNGCSYLVFGPQAYLAVPESGKRFSLQLEGFYEFLLKSVKPLKVFDHFDQVMLERFVLEHSSNLLDSTEFLRLAQSRGYGKIYVYDLKLIMPLMMRRLMEYKRMREGGHG
ncbi:MAG: glycosyltransferase family 39 protein [Candidatus Omnitrophota bacterium]